MTQVKTLFRTFRTADLVVFNYPLIDKGGISHVVMYLEAEHSPIGQAAVVHANLSDKTPKDNRVMVAPAADIFEEQDGVPGAHVQPAQLQPELVQTIQEVARVFGQDAPPTPYGNTPKKGVAERANRFVGMVKTESMAQIPLDITCLYRILKWTHRANTVQPLSESRGITCAAFASAVFQTAAMLAYLRGFDHKNPKPLARLPAALKTINAMLETKAHLREVAQLTKAKKGSEGFAGRKKEKQYHHNQALRQNSHRRLADGQHEAMDEFIAGLGDYELVEFPRFGEDDFAVSTLDRQWVFIQQELLGINRFEARSVAQILPTGLRFDAKFVNSRILPDALQSSGWQLTRYDGQ